MKLYLKILFLSFLFIISVNAQRGQGNFSGGSIYGKVFDSLTKHTIEYANIVIFSLRDSSMVTGGVTNNEGAFNIPLEKPGRFKVEIRFIGYDTEIIETVVNPSTPNVNLGDVLIHPSTINLNDVVVQGERSPVTYEIDKKVINPDQMQTVISGNAADILANVPSVQVDVEGNVSLRGSQNFTVLIDGRPSLMEGQDALQQISATSIERIEIITNPTAKYDADGTAGIINIIMKKNLGQELSGIFNANAGMYDTYGGNFLINYQDGFKANIGLDYNQRHFPGDQTQNNIYYLENGTSTINSLGEIERRRVSFEGRAGIEFDLSDHDVLNLGLRVGKREGGFNSNQNFSEFTSIAPSESLYTGRNERTREGTYYSFNSNYTRTFDLPGHQLFAEFLISKQSSDEFTTTSEFDEFSQISGRKTTENGPSTDFRGKLDYTLPFSEVSKFEAGYQGEIELSDESNDLFEYNPATNEYEIQTQFSSLTKYNESQHSLYSMYSDMLWVLNYQLGLRAEYTYRNIEVPSINQTFNIDRIDYFPSLHSSYKITPVSTIMASYSRRINRPGGWALEPFPTWVDANNVRIGNPDLLPEFINSLETGLQTILGNVNLSTELYYRQTINKIEFVRTALEENVTLTTFSNVGEDYSLGGELMLIFDLFGFWNVNLMGNVYNYRVEGNIQGEAFSNESFNWQTRMNNTFKLWSSTQIQFNLNYNSPTVTSQGRWEEFFSSDLSIRQEIIENILAVTLQIRDVFGTAKREYTSEGINLYNYNQFDMHTPALTLNLRYTFNNYKPKREGRGEDNGTFEGGEDF
ncbi:MAG: TonB-dependent receptor [bacterium]|nr:TonB-dependent receptor [bacterium]